MTFRFDRKAVVSLVVAVTNECERLERAPFDHAQLLVPNGDNPAGTDAMVEIPAAGAGGSSTPLKPFLNLNPLFMP